MLGEGNYEMLLSVLHNKSSPYLQFEEAKAKSLKCRVCYAMQWLKRVLQLLGHQPIPAKLLLYQVDRDLDVDNIVVHHDLSLR